MIDFPIDELLDDAACLTWLEQHLHPNGFGCPRCGATERRLARRSGAFPAYRCRRCDRYHTILTGTAFQKTHQTPAKLVLILRGIAKGESTARLGRELDVSRRQMGTLRQRVQQNLCDTLPREVSEEAIFEADELYQNAGEKRRAPPRS
jgi:transposase-like protein